MYTFNKIIEATCSFRWWALPMAKSGSKIPSWDETNVKGQNLVIVS